MNQKITCSFGEIVDKYIILKLKKQNTKDNNSLQYIDSELSTISNECKKVNEQDKLFDILYKINNELWILEDMIREKINIKEYDNEYLNISKKIHELNDNRYKIKNEINTKYNSSIKEIKIYKKNNKIVGKSDIIALENGKRLYSIGKFKDSLIIINYLINKYKDYPIYTNFYVDLMFSYINICEIFKITNEYEKKINYIIEHLNELIIMNELKEHCKYMYTLYCLSNNKYKKVYKYLNNLNYIVGPNITKETMDFFKSSDNNKTLLLYNGGGLGDIIMFSRFIKPLCEKYHTNNVIFLIDTKIKWIYDILYKSVSNLKLISYDNLNKITNFDYHCSIMSLIKYLNYTYESLSFFPLFKYIDLNISNKVKDIIKGITNTNKTYIFNWKGNSKNLHELYNRGMNLLEAIPLFKLPNINWIVVTKDITEDEKNILNKYNIPYYGDIIDNEKAFYDTITIMRNVTGVVSTDTSLVHLAANLDVCTFVLLTLGSEWRWTNSDKTNWYPDVTLLRQKEQGNWKHVIENLINII